MSHKKQFCKNGHDKNIVGSYSNSTCKKCTAERTAVYDPIKMRAYKKAYKYKHIEDWRQSTKDWKLKNPESTAASARKTRLKKYGLTEDDFNKLIEDQNSCCAICDKELILSGKAGCKVDHCHKTGVVRGILCSTCNTGIGHLKDNIKILESAIIYLNKVRVV